jgi:hypothetical protein
MAGAGPIFKNVYREEQIELSSSLFRIAELSPLRPIARVVISGKK